MKRLAHAAVLTLLATLTLSGCIRYNVDMTLSENNTASGNIVIAVQKGVGEQMGVANDHEALAQLFGEPPFGAEFTPKEYADGDWVGQSYTFDDVPITELADLVALQGLLVDGAAVFADPARRTAAGRSWRVADLTPSWEFVTGLLRGRTGCIKAAPGLPTVAIPDGVATTWVSHRGDLVEASLWSGPWSAGSRTAVLLPSGQVLLFGGLWAAYAFWWH